MHRRFQLAAVIATTALLGASLVRAPYAQDQVLLHTPTIVALLVLTWIARRPRVSDASVVCVTLFLWLHILGSRYTYSLVPYDDWSRSLFGWSVTERFHLARNHYDRSVHFAFGILAMVPFVELLERGCGVRRRVACVLGVALVLAVGALYEIFEWLLTLVANPVHAERYNGQQGDAWDAQKDMTCAMVGAVLMAAIMVARAAIARRRSAALES